METLRGDMSEESLLYAVTRETVPCGTCITTTFYAKDDGQLVRQDVLIEVDVKKLELTGSTGSLG